MPRAESVHEIAAAIDSAIDSLPFSEIDNMAVACSGARAALERAGSLELAVSGQAEAAAHKAHQYLTTTGTHLASYRAHLIGTAYDAPPETGQKEQCPSRRTIAPWPPRNPATAEAPSAEAAAHFKQLIRIFNPLGKMAAREILTAIGDPAFETVLHEGAQATLQYHNLSLMKLPADFFDHVSFDAHAIKNDPLATAYQYYDRTNPAVVAASRDREARHGHPAIAIHDIRWALAQLDSTDDLQQSWEMLAKARSTLAAAGHSDAFIGTLYNHIKRNTNGKSNIPWMQHRHAAFLYSSAKPNTADHLTDSTVTPIGDYGEAFDAKVNAAARFGATVIHSKLESVAEGIWAEDEATLRRTTRGSTGGLSHMTVGESWQSVGHVISLLTGQKVKGYPTGEELLHDIIAEGLIERLTQLLPLGLIGPAALNGKFYRRPLYVNKQGKLDLHPVFVRRVIDYHKLLSATAKLYLTPGHFELHGTGIICPVSGKGGALSDLGKAYEKVVQAAA